MGDSTLDSEIKRGAVSADLLWQACGAFANLRLMPAHDHGSIQLHQASLTTREQREFARAERTIARGLKSFLEVGLALKAICDQRLYGQQFDSFEAYCIQRWELSRPRAYEPRTVQAAVEYFRHKGLILLISFGTPLIASSSPSYSTDM